MNNRQTVNRSLNPCNINLPLSTELITLTTTNEHRNEPDMTTIWNGRDSGTISTSSGHIEDPTDTSEFDELFSNIHSDLCLPLATSTPISDIPIVDIFRSEQDIENDLFKNIQRFISDFVNLPNRLYPYYRVMTWNTNGQVKMKHFATVIINRPTIISRSTIF